MTTKLALVYQAGIANVFDVGSFDALSVSDCDPIAVPQGSQIGAHRIYQGDFRSAERFCEGAGYAGAEVRAYACNRAGDIAHWHWSTDLESAPFSDRFRFKATAVTR